MDQFNPIVSAHKHSSNHRDELMASELSGCFYCLEIYPPTEIYEWTDEGQCAIGAKCGIDSVIGSKSAFPITKEFLQQMRTHWFD